MGTDAIPLSVQRHIVRDRILLVFLPFMRMQTRDQGRKSHENRHDISLAEDQEENIQFVIGKKSFDFPVDEARIPTSVVGLTVFLPRP
jgi:hypothetical protein